MGTNACWIQLRAEGPVTAERIVSELEGYWTKLGARVVGRSYKKMEPLSLEKTGRLGYVVGGLDDDGWIQVADSERYTADFGVAKHLARAFATRVLFTGYWDVSNTEIERWIEPPGAKKRRPKQRPRPPHIYFDKVDASDRIAGAIVFGNVARERYDSGPEPTEVPSLPPPVNHVATQQAIAKKLDVKAARKLLEEGTDDTVATCLPIFLSPTLDLADAKVRRFTLAVSEIAFRRGLTAPQLVRIAEAAAREGYVAVIDAVRTKLKPPPTALLSMIAKRLDVGGEDEAAALVRRLL